MKKFFAEFKKFITRGNVIDLAVGVIIGGTFTAIVTALTTNILQPLINFVIFLIAGESESLDGVYTFLVGNSSDLSNAIYIDWGAFISAVINFLLVAWVLFIVIKVLNRFNSNGEKLAKNLALGVLTKEERKQMKEQGLNYKDLKAVRQFKLKQQEEQKLLEEKRLKEEAEKQEEAKKHTTEYLLEQIKEILEKK